MFKDLKPTQKFILIIILILVVLIVSYQAYKYFEKRRSEKLINDNTETVSANGQTVAINIGTKASEINDALHGSWYSEDEVKAINAVLSVPKPLIPNLSCTYFALTNINLKADLQNYLSADQWLQIQSQFN